MKAGKKWYLSKTFWVNLIGIFGIIIQSYTGFVLDPKSQALILGVINLILRTVTKEPITW